MHAYKVRPDNSYVSAPPTRARAATRVAVIDDEVTIQAVESPALMMQRQLADRLAGDDVEWIPPAIRVAIVVGLAALAWTPVALIVWLSVR